MKHRWILTGKRYYHSCDAEGLKVMRIMDIPEQKCAYVLVIGKWAYEYTKAD